MTPQRFVIYGNPVIKKNSRTIRKNFKTGARFIGKSFKLEAEETRVHLELLQQKAQETITEPCSVQFKFYCGTQHKRDLSNLYQLYEDCLQSSGVIADDSLIESHDGSRKYYDKENPRVEIYITDFKK